MFFETPGVTQATVAQVPFEFTLVEMSQVESQHSLVGGRETGMDAVLKTAMDQRKLAGTCFQDGALLVCPCPTGQAYDKNLVTLSTFVKQPDLPQDKRGEVWQLFVETWRLVGETLEEQLRDGQPRFVSTHGGYRHLHIRIEKEPKNYTVPEYKTITAAPAPAPALTPAPAPVPTTFFATPGGAPTPSLTPATTPGLGLTPAQAQPKAGQAGAGTGAISFGGGALTSFGATPAPATTPGGVSTPADSKAPSTLVAPSTGGTAGAKPGGFSFGGGAGAQGGAASGSGGLGAAVTTTSGAATSSFNFATGANAAGVAMDKTDPTFRAEFGNSSIQDIHDEMVATMRHDYEVFCKLQKEITTTDEKINAYVQTTMKLSNEVNYNLQPTWTNHEMEIQTLEGKLNVIEVCGHAHKGADGRGLIISVQHAFTCALRLF
jgi:hypothetical protein